MTGSHCSGVIPCQVVGEGEVWKAVMLLVPPLSYLLSRYH